MPTPAIQTLINDAQQVLNLDSISAVRSVVAVSLANANTGTPLNPNLTTQQLWNEFYQVVTRSKSDIESIIANQLMKFLYSPPAPGGVGANKQVIFNDGGVLAGDAGLTYDKATDALTVAGDLTVDTSTLKVDSANNRVGIRTASPSEPLTVDNTSGVTTGAIRISAGDQAHSRLSIQNLNGQAYHLVAGNPGASNAGFALYDNTAAATRWYVDNTGVQTWSNVGGVAGTAMTLNSTGLGVGVTPSAWNSAIKAVQSSRSSIASNGITTWFGSNVYYDSTYTPTYIANEYAGALAYNPAGFGGWAFYTASAGTGTITGFSTAKMTLDESGRLLVGPTSANASGGVLQLSSGITFPATQVASSDANTLDDYEEGTFTPTVTAASGTPVSTTVNSAVYTKVGRQVTLQIDISVVDAGTASSSLIFSVPFTHMAGSVVQCGSFRENGSTGFMGMLATNAATSVFALLYNNATPWVNGYRVVGTYTYFT